MARQMKDSGVEWIGEIPEEWSMVKLKVLLEEVKKKNIENKRLALKFTYGNIVNKQVHEKDDLSPYTCVEPNDVIVNGLNLEFDFISQRVGLVKTSGVITSAYICMRPTNLCNAPYICYLLKAADGYKVLHSMGRGLRQILSYKELSSYSFVLPPIMEQIKVAAYLDTKCAEIDKVIEQTRATIEEYKKLKQAIITEAVTKGVRGPRPMKPSGVEWIGDIPEEWHRSRVGLHYHVVLGKMLCNTQQADDYTLEPYYCAADIHFGSVDAAKKEMWFSPEEKDTYRVMPGDLLVVEGGAGAGGCAIVKASVTATYIQNSIMIVRGKSTCSVAYLGYWIESLVKRAYIDVVCNKATIPHFTKDKLSSVPIPLPSAEEQQEIAVYLDTKCAEIDRIIEKKEQLIEELGSYKKSLIYEYVTGKKEVTA